jgi:hypothetical protein
MLSYPYRGYLPHKTDNLQLKWLHKQPFNKFPIFDMQNLIVCRKRI